MAAASDSGENSVPGGDTNRILYISDIRTASYEARLLGDHAVPNSTRIFVAMVTGPQQLTFESS
jgi:hypothetical protein